MQLGTEEGLSDTDLKNENASEQGFLQIDCLHLGLLPSGAVGRIRVCSSSHISLLNSLSLH